MVESLENYIEQNRKDPYQFICSSQVFEDHLKFNCGKYEIYKKGQKRRKITEFDSWLISRLRKVFYACYTGNLYLYGTKTSFETVGNKAELLTQVLNDKNYYVVHGETNSSRTIPFYLYSHKHLDYNTWIEYEDLEKIYVLDPFSMKKYEKDIYYEIEEPEIKRIIPKNLIISHPARVEEENRHISREFIIIPIIQGIEKTLELHPYKDIIKQEIALVKYLTDYEDRKIEKYLFEKNYFLDKK